MGNEALLRAKHRKNDELYTLREDIEPELSAYLTANPSLFEDKTIILPCDDHETSNFYAFFKDNFAKLRLRHLTATRYCETAQTLFREDEARPPLRADYKRRALPAPAASLSHEKKDVFFLTLVFCWQSPYFNAATKQERKMIRQENTSEDAAMLRDMLSRGEAKIARHDASIETHRGGKTELRSETDWYVLGPEDMDDDGRFPATATEATIQDITRESGLTEEEVAEGLVRGRSISGTTVYEYNPAKPRNERASLVSEYSISENQWTMVNLKQWARRYEKIQTQIRRRDALRTQECINAIKKKMSGVRGGFTSAGVKGLDVTMKHPEGCEPPKVVTIDGFALRDGTLFVSWTDPGDATAKRHLSLAERLGPESLQETANRLTGRKTLGLT